MIAHFGYGFSMTVLRRFGKTNRNFGPQRGA